MNKVSELIDYITELEGKKKAVNRAQVSEIVKITLTALANESYGNVAKLLKRYTDMPLPI